MMKYATVFVTCLIFTSALFAAEWYPIAPPREAPRKPVILDASRDYNAPGGVPIRKLMDVGVRDPSILAAPDDYYYMVGTAEGSTLPEPVKGDPEANFWITNEGIPLWRSKDLTRWETMGYVWQFERDGTWSKAFGDHKEHGKIRAIWAPEIHYMKGTYWICYSRNTYDMGILKSESGKPEGPYVDIKKDGTLVEKDIDGSLFEDKDGAVYFLYAGYMIAKMKGRMEGGLAERPHRLDFQPDPPWAEGIAVILKDGKYIWYGAANSISKKDGHEVRTYDCFAATSDSLSGPYTNRYRAIPYAGHTTIFKGFNGNWWATMFHGQPYLDWPMNPGVIPIEIDQVGKITVKRSHPRPIWKYTIERPGGQWYAERYNDDFWKEAEAGFGDPAIMNVGAVTDVATEWTSPSIWLRRKFELKAVPETAKLFLRYPEGVEVLINGHCVFKSSTRPDDYIEHPFDVSVLKPGVNTICVQCTTTPDGNEAMNYFDLGIVE